VKTHINRKPLATYLLKGGGEGGLGENRKKKLFSLEKRKLYKETISVIQKMVFFSIEARGATNTFFKNGARESFGGGTDLPKEGGKGSLRMAWKLLHVKGPFSAVRETLGGGKSLTGMC